MSLKGLELDFGVQGTDKQKSIMQTDLMSQGINLVRYSPLGGQGSNSVETDRQTAMTKKGAVGKVLLIITSNSNNAVVTIKLRKNENDATPLLQFTIPALNSVNQESVLSVGFESDDFMAWEIETLGSSGNILFKITSQVELDS